MRSHSPARSSFVLGVFTSLGLVVGCTSETPTFDTATVSRFESALASTQTSEGSAGTLMLVEDGAGRRWVGATGAADLEADTPATEDTLFRSASIAKTFTGALVLSLHEEGLLSIDDPISTYVPRVPRGDEITLRMLLQHTSGIVSYTRTPPYQEALASDRTRTFTADELIDMAIAEPADFPPGAAWNYSNTGYILLGVAVESVVGRSIADECTARFFVPLGMTDTRALSSGTPDALWSSYVPGGAAGPAAVVTPTSYAADGGYVTSLHDMAIWAREFLGGRLHRRETLALADVPAGGAVLEGVAQAYGYETGGYGMGYVVALDPALGDVRLGAGNTDGARTFVGYSTDADVGFVVAVNVGEGAAPLVETLSAARPLLAAVRETFGSR
ncbi:serine hydrolase domain-containing protein [Sandaracinus amylolyticus]|uniref:Beta-lactamase n=1 Tax=Sandaracinus amylolyticus TaxID=927083 RepID=A0A0F6W0H8_9BACT|nr:serine hydrolase domain-containing protein [Sandaracinus amylolyticus]AKF04350.1 beta-lactamase [Sandaracinus amylolyticus]